MKTIRSLGAIALFLFACTASMAQSNSIPQFDSDAKKQAWIESNPDKYSSMLQSNKVVSSDRTQLEASEKSSVKKMSRQEMTSASRNMQKSTPVSRVTSKETFASEKEKNRWKAQQRK
jgi:hypothetical protein